MNALTPVAAPAAATALAAPAPGPMAELRSAIVPCLARSTAVATCCWCS